MKDTIYVVELRAYKGREAQIVAVTAHPEVVAAVRRAWARLVFAEPEPRAEGRPGQRSESDARRP